MRLFFLKKKKEASSSFQTGPVLPVKLFASDDGKARVQLCIQHSGLEWSEWFLTVECYTTSRVFQKWKSCWRKNKKTPLRNLSLDP